MLPLLRTTIVKRRTSPVVTSPAFRSLTDLVEMVKFGDAVMFVVAVVGFTAAGWVLVGGAGGVVGAACSGAPSRVSFLRAEAVSGMVVPFGPAAPTWTTSVCVDVAPAARFPMFHVTVPAASVPGALAETNVVLAGMASVRTTP